MNLREAAQQALDVMEDTRWAVADQAPNEDVAAHDKAMNTLRAALAEDAMQRLTDEQQMIESHIAAANKMVATIRQEVTVEPVAYSYTDARGRTVLVGTNTAPYEDAKPLYAAPPKREQLTDEELYALGAESHEDIAFARRVLAAHGIGGEE